MCPHFYIVIFNNSKLNENNEMKKQEKRFIALMHIRFQYIFYGTYILLRRFIKSYFNGTIFNNR